MPNRSLEPASSRPGGASHGDPWSQPALGRLQLARWLPHLGESGCPEQDGETPGLVRLEAQVARPFALLDSAGRLIFASRRFRFLAESSRVLSLGGDRIRAWRPADRTRLDALLAAALDLGSGKAAPPVRLVGPDAARGLVLRIAPTGSSWPLVGGIRPSAIAVLVDLDGRLLIPPDELQAIWGLSPREAEIALRLAGGETVERAASRLAISAATVRQHVKSIFGKMEIDRQGELVRLVSRLAG